MKLIIRAAPLGLALLLAAPFVLPAAFGADITAEAWSWPSAAMDPAVRAEIIRQHYTMQEHRNIQTALENLSGTDRMLDPDRWRSAQRTERPPGPGGFSVIHGMYGRPERNGWYNPGFPNQTKTVEDIIAHGDRVATIWKITGNITGPFFGFEGYGQPINTREQSVARYDDEGKYIDNNPWSGEDLVLYEQLGGKLQLP